jgi:L-cysteine desulfidase
MMIESNGSIAHNNGIISKNVDQTINNLKLFSKKTTRPISDTVVEVLDSIQVKS